MTNVATMSSFGVVRQPKTVFFGGGQRAAIASTVTGIGRHVLVCTDPRMAGTAEFTTMVDDIRSHGADVRVFADVLPDLPRHNVDDLAAAHRSNPVDVIVGIGGGSCMDMAKAASVALTFDRPLPEFYGEFTVPGPTIPIVTVPTTAGTGAEATCIAVIYDEDEQMKVGIASPYLEATASIVDPEFTLTCPPGLTSATGADALSHLIEAFTARDKRPDPHTPEKFLYYGKSVLTDDHCRLGLALLARSLGTVRSDPGDLSARTDVMKAAHHAGIAINTTGTAAAHALQSPIGALTHTPHGVGVGCLLHYVMRFNLDARKDEFAEIASLFGVSSQAHDRERQAKAGIEAVDALLDSIGTPPDLRALGLARDAIPMVAEHALRATRLTANNPRTLDRQSMTSILEHAYEGDRSWS